MGNHSQTPAVAARRRRRNEVLSVVSSFNETAVAIWEALSAVSRVQARECGCVDRHLWDIADAIAVLGAAGMLTAATWDALEERGVLKYLVSSALSQAGLCTDQLRPCCMRAVRAVIACCEACGRLPSMVQTCQRAMHCKVIMTRMDEPRAAMV